MNLKSELGFLASKLNNNNHISQNVFPECNEYVISYYTVWLNQGLRDFIQILFPFYGLIMSEVLGN